MNHLTRHMRQMRMSVSCSGKGYCRFQAAAAALGQSLDLIVPDAFRARHWAGFQRAMEAPQVKDLAADIPVLCADGQVKEFVGRLLVLSDGLGAALGAMGIFAADGTTGIKPFG